MRVRVKHLFGTTHLNLLQYRYVYDFILPCMHHVFQMRINIAPEHEDMIRRIIVKINELSGITTQTK